MEDYYFDELYDLIGAVQGGLLDVLTNDVAPVVEDILQKHIKSDIYDAYTPKENGWIGGETYRRRHMLESNVKSMLEPDGTLLTTSDAVAGQSVVKGHEFSNKYAGAFLQLLESGHMGIWRAGFARPAVSGAQREVENSGKISRAIRTGIEREMG